MGVGGCRVPRDITLSSLGIGVFKAYFQYFYNVNIRNLNFPGERGGPHPLLDPRMDSKGNLNKRYDTMIDVI